MIYVICDMSYDHYEFCSVLDATTDENKAIAIALEYAIKSNLKVVTSPEEHRICGDKEEHHIYIDEFKDE